MTRTKKQPATVPPVAPKRGRGRPRKDGALGQDARTIRVDPEVYAALSSLATGLDDTANRILRRLLALDS